jgi:peptide/nickel transport system substrate-binding protein
MEPRVQPRGTALLALALTGAVLLSACAPAAAPPPTAPAAAPTTAPAAKPTTAPAARQPLRGRRTQADHAPAHPAAPTTPRPPPRRARSRPARGTVHIPIGPTDHEPVAPQRVRRVAVRQSRALRPASPSPGKDLSPAPDLASSWEAAPDGLSWTFKLRDDAKWTDGQPINADDVAFTFNDIVLKKDLGANGAGNFSAVQSVEATSPTSVKFNLSRKFSALPSYLAYNAGILPKHIFAGQADPWGMTSFNKGTPISSGPFKVENYTSGQSVVLARNDAYFGGKAYLDKLVFKVVPDANTQIAQALSGELSIMIMDNKAAVDRVKSASQVRVEPRQLVQYYWLSLNQTDARFQDVKVRQVRVCDRSQGHRHSHR